MDKGNNPSMDTNNEEAMNRVNQTFDKITQDVKEMITNNNDNTSENDQYS